MLCPNWGFRPPSPPATLNPAVTPPRPDGTDEEETAEQCLDLTDPSAAYDDFDIIFGSFRTHSSALYHATHAMWWDLIGDHGHWMLIGAWNTTM